MSAPLISPSAIALQSVGQTPIGAPATDATRCTLCGIAIAVGQLCLPYKPSDSFTDYSSMAYRGGDHICGWCAGVINDGRFTQQWANAVFTGNGIYRAGKNVEIAYWLLNPPTQPFIWVKLGAKKQHLIWRAPVNYGPKVIQVRFGELVLTIRPSLLHDAVAASRLLANVGFDKKSKRKSAFNVSARDLDSPRQGSVHHVVRAGVAASIAQAGEHATDYEKALSLLSGLTPGENWALTSLLYVPESLGLPEQLPI